MCRGSPTVTYRSSRAGRTRVKTARLSLGRNRDAPQETGRSPGEFLPEERCVQRLGHGALRA